MLSRKKPDDRLRIIEVLKLRGVYLPDPPTPEDSRHFDEARRRCLACSAKKLCDEAIAAAQGSCEAGA